MTILASQTERETIGIRTWEQAILYSANLLLAGENINGTNFNRDFTIILDNDTNTISLNIVLQLDYFRFYASNSNIFKGIAYLEGIENNREVQYLGQTLPTNIEITFVEPPAEVNSLEAFYLYSVIEFKKYLQSNSLDDSIVTWDFDQRKTSVATNLALAFWNNIYKQENDSLIALNLNQYLTSVPQQFGDGVQLTDDLQLNDGIGQGGVNQSQLSDNLQLNDNLQLVD